MNSNDTKLEEQLPPQARLIIEFFRQRSSKGGANDDGRTPTISR